jgi:nucleotide-binding universal stress UspA family protein
MTTETIQRILVPSDMSDFSKSAAAWAAMFQRRLGSRITLLFANEPYVPFDILEGPAAYLLQSQPEVRLRMIDDLKKFASECFPEDGPAIETVIVDSDPARAIVDTANRIDADLIVMGTHGRRGWRRALLGSVTETVLRETSRTLLSVPASLAAGPKIDVIVCPVNFTDIGRRAVEEAASLARTFAADLLVVHVADLIEGPLPAGLEEEFAAWVEPDLRERCKYRQVIARGDSAEQVLEIASQAQADLLVIGAQHKRFSDTTIIGSTTERVVRHARQPVWTVVSRAVATHGVERPWLVETVI